MAGLLEILTIGPPVNANYKRPEKESQTSDVF